MKPGGLALTKRLLSLCAPAKGGKALDVGCGDGRTVNYLRKGLGLDAWGLDIRPGVGKGLLTGNARALPFEAASFDALIFECSLSAMDAPDAALAEAARVLKPQGTLYIADLYAPGSPAALPSPAPPLPWRFEPWEALAGRFARAGLRVVCFEDHTPELLSYWGRLLFEGAEPCRALPPGFQGAYFLAALEPERFTPQSLAEYQERKGREAAARAREKSPFYQEGNGGFIDAAAIAAQGPRMLCVPLGEIARIRTLNSSGTTGAPKRLWFTEGDLERTAAFFAWGMRPLARSGGRCAIMMSNDAPGSVADMLRRGLARIGVSSVIHGAIQGPDALSAAAGADCLVGFPAEIFWLCRYAPQLRPETVLLSADYVSDSLIKALTETWGCRVFTHYGLTETCYGLAVQCCAQEGHHVRLEDYSVTIIDPQTGEALPPEQDGEIVLTSLRSEAMPLIQYRTGDIGSLITRPCGCGSALPRLGKIRGRRENLMRPLHIHGLDDLLFAQPALNAYRAVLDQGMLRLIIEGTVDERLLAEKLQREIQVSYGPVLPYLGKRNILMRG
ncbi:MAG: methyltransferase domain-containing protein [Treponema sp.]|jgi:phenylacetate-coenzyme A ligase PaaK-like adenylate-forming protein|nr:methyltransferase domain-containing protein [Treponema sp.]